MGDWIDAIRADEEKRRKSEERHDEVKFHRFEVINKKKHALWNALMTVVNRDVEKFRTTFKGQREIELTRVHDLAFRIYKTPFPTVLMDAEIPYNGTSIKVSYIRTFNLTSPMERSGESFELTIDSSDNLLVAHNGRILPNLDSVSRFMLEPVFRVD